MFNFIKNLFSVKNQYGTGLIDVPVDSRNINLAMIQKPIVVPDVYINDIENIGVNDQGLVPSCVGHSIAKIAEYYVFRNTGKLVKFDADRLYEACKKEDGYPNSGGTFPSIAAKIIIRDGIDKIDTDSNDKVVNGYAFVDKDFESVKQAIYQNGVVTIGITIDKGWFKGIIGRLIQSAGGHQTVLHGYDTQQEYIYGLNSWSKNWIGRIAGVFDKNIKPGFYHAKWSDISINVLSIISLTKIPKEIIDEVRNTDYVFTTTMRLGMASYEVKKLQERLGGLPITGYFGNLTLAKVKEYQSNHFLVADGIVGPLMRSMLNSKPIQSKLSLWIQAITDMEGAKPSRNNPGNLRFIGQKYAVNDGGFCKFDTPKHGYDALKTLLINACTGKSKVYKPTMTLLDFYNKYAPSTDGNDPKNYANFVAKRIGVTSATRIAELI
jgi:hypothetical protein